MSGSILVLIQIFKFKFLLTFNTIVTIGFKTFQIVCLSGRTILKLQ